MPEPGTEPDEFTPGRLRGTVTRIGWALVVAATVALAAAPVVAWSTRYDQSLWSLSVPAAVAVLLLGPVASAATTAGWWWNRAGRGAAALAMLAAVIAGWVAWRQLSDVPDRGIGLGGPVAVLAAIALVLGWLLLTIALVPRYEPRARGPVVGWLAAGCVLGLLAVAAVPAVDWYRAGRFVDHTTGAALPDLSDQDPADIAGERWRVPAPQSRLVGTAGRYVVLQAESPDLFDGWSSIRVIDGATGDEHWRYLRSDLSVETTALSHDGSLVVSLVTGLDERMLLAFETATGQLRWRRDLPPDLLGQRSFAIDVLPAEGALVLTTQCGELARHRIRNDFYDYRCHDQDGTMIALDPQTGADRWQWSPEPIPLAEPDDGGPAEAPCYGVAVAAAGASIAVQLECPTWYEDHLLGNPWFGPAHQEFVGISAADGTELWRQEPPGRADHLFGPRGHLPLEDQRPTIHGYQPDGVLVQVTGPYEAPDGTVDDSPPRWVALDSTDGTVRYEIATDSDAFAFTGGLAVYEEGSLPAEAVALDLATGEERWRSRLLESTGTQTFVTASEQTAYLMRYQGTLESGFLSLPRQHVELIAVRLADGEVLAMETHEVARLACYESPCLGLAGGSLTLVTAPREGDTVLRGIG